jgi:outer membrane murein-binding lipoprotein Lpp
MTNFRTVLQVGAFLVASLFLSGCDKLKEIDKLKGNAATSQQQVVDLQGNILTLRAELAAVRERLEALEAAQKKVVSPAGSQRLSEEQIATVSKAISQCVQMVRGSMPTSEVYTNFDAYYNPASATVQNNNKYVDQSAVYAFNKCMASKGVPLS